MENPFLLAQIIPRLLYMSIPNVSLDQDPNRKDGCVQRHPSYIMDFGNWLVTIHHLIELSALKYHCLKVLIMSIVALRRWIRKQTTMGQGC